MRVDATSIGPDEGRSSIRCLISRDTQLLENSLDELVQFRCSGGPICRGMAAHRSQMPVHGLELLPAWLTTSLY